jgi:hypothetical protein
LILPAFAEDEPVGYIQLRSSCYLDIDAGNCVAIAAFDPARGPF